MLHFIRSDLQSHFRNPFSYGGHQSSWSLRLLCWMCSGNPRWSWQCLFIGQASVLHLGSSLFIWDLSSLITLFFFKGIPFYFYYLFLFIYSFYFGCVGSSFLCEGFLQVRRAGATLHRSARASHYRGLSCCGAQAPDAQAQ